MNPLLKPTTICLRISSIIYFLLGLIFVPLIVLVGMEEPVLAFMFIFFFFFTVAIGVFIEVVIAGLKKHKSWTWMAALILCIMYIPSAFVVLGVIGIIPLFKEEVKKDFNW